jgi:type I restriction enzyme S subunit
MSFPRYPEYKASGVEWLGDVPGHWDVAKTAWHFKIAMGQTILQEDLIENGQIPVFSATEEDHYFGRVNEARVRLDIGDLVIPARGNSIGFVKMVSEPSTTTQTTIYCRNLSRDLLLSKYTYLFLSGMKTNLFHFTQTAIPQITVSEVGKNPILIPPIQEQQAIADFLDRETTKIDGLIEEQRRLVELLKEKRQAVISHAVTKGLNPNAPMKPSGIEWLGDIPEHWNLCTVRRVITRIEQGWSPECNGRPAEKDEWGVVKSGCVNRGNFVESENKALPEKLNPIEGYEIHNGDILMSRASGSPELVGSTAYIYNIRPRLMLSDKIFRIHLTPDIDKEFFVAYFNSRTMRTQIEQSISGADGLANNIPQSALKRFSFVFPTLTEQRVIIELLKSKLMQIESFCSEAEKSITLLQERRTALISAAVTGKIDVRGLANAESTV